VLAIIAILRGGTSLAFRVVFLPVLLTMPTYFYWVAKPLPSINFLDGTLVVLGVGMLLTNVSRWRFTRTDLWMLAFVISSFYQEYLLEHTGNVGVALFTSIVGGLIPYLCGKLIVEQTQNRVPVVKTYIWIIVVSSFVSAWEYVARSNPYTYFWSHFYPGQWGGWKTQIRWGFGRVAGPFSQSELAGMMVFTAWLLALWIGRRNYQEQDAGKFPASLLKNGKRHIWILFVALFTTQARGPWIGALIAVAVASIGRARRPVRRAVIVFTCFVLIGLPAYIFGKDYLAGPRKDFGSEKETAQYRQELIANYIPIAQRGGAWGWGEGFPRVDGQVSIDNEYLWVWILQGYVGLGALVLLMSEASLTLVLRGIGASDVRERHFCFTLLGIMLGIAFTLSTVFMGDQSYELVFLLVGWSQAIRQPRVIELAIRNEEVFRPASEPEYSAV
jgi:hypothetical protein